MFCFVILDLIWFARFEDIWIWRCVVRSLCSSYCHSDLSFVRKIGSWNDKLLYRNDFRYFSYADSSKESLFSMCILVGIQCFCLIEFAIFLDIF